MRALIVGSMGHERIAETVSACAADADLVVAADGGAGLALDAGVRPDLVVGDLDSIDESVAAWLGAEGVEVVRYPVDKDVSDLDLALDACEARGASHVTVAGVSGGRVDHALAALGSLLSRPSLQAVVADPDFELFLLPSGGICSTEVRPVGAPFSVLALVGSATVSCTGARWSLDHKELAPMSSQGLSNVADADHCIVTVHSGAAIVVVWRPDSHLA